MQGIELRLECIRIASENLKSSTGQALDQEVLEYAEKLFNYVLRGEPAKKAA